MSRTLKIGLAAVAGVLAVIVMLVSWAGGKAADFVKKEAANQQVLKGTLSIGDVGASFSGDVWAKDIIWNDPAGNLIAKIPRLNVHISVGDVLGGNLNAKSISSVVLENPELYVTYSEKDGINIMNMINASDEKEEKKEDKKESDKPAGEMSFRGILAIENGLLDIKSGRSNLRYESLSASLDHKSFPLVKGTMQAKQNKADFAGNIEINHLPGGKYNVKINVDGRSILLTDFFNMVPVESNLKLNGGTIPTLKIAAELDDGQPLKMQVDGSIDGLKGESEGYKIDAVKGKFNGNQDVITFTDFTGTLNAQPISASGKVTIKDYPYKLDINVQSTAFKISALSPGIDITEPFAFNADITGTPDDIRAKGSFSAASIHTEQMDLVNVKGNVDYKNDVVNLFDTTAGVYGGTVHVNGDVNVASQVFDFKINGSGINVKSMTDTNITGPLSFNMKATGSGDTNAMNVNGPFVVGKGTFNGIPFNSITGNVAKSGATTRFSSVVINTIAGSVNTNATIDANGKVKLDNVDLKDLKGDSAKESVKEKVAEEVEKNKDKLSKALKKIF